MYSWGRLVGDGGGDGGWARWTASAALRASVAFLSRSICSRIRWRFVSYCNANISVKTNARRIYKSNTHCCTVISNLRIFLPQLLYFNSNLRLPCHQFPNLFSQGNNISPRTVQILLDL